MGSHSCPAQSRAVRYGVDFDEIRVRGNAAGAAEMNLRRQSPVVGAGKGEPSTGVRTTIGDPKIQMFELSALS